MRLNLPNHHCIAFSMVSQFTAPKEKDAEIQAFMDRTMTRQDEDDDGVLVTAAYGSVSRSGGVPHRVSAVLTKKSREDGVAMTLMAEIERDAGIEPPPRGMRSVNYLIEAASDLFGPIDVACHALFEYDSALGFKSRARLPIPLIIPDDPNGVTHIESAQFSRRDADGIVYTIAVGEPDDGAGIAHSVDFESTVSLGHSQVRELFDSAISISMPLISLW